MVETAASAAEAKEKLKSESFDIVITDMKMETKTSGWDVVRAARQAPGEPAIAILTAYPDLGSDWKNEGATLLLTKPMKGDEFLSRVEELMARRAQQRQNSRELPAKPGLTVPAK